MKANRIFDRYIIREFIPPFLGGLCLFSFILMMDKVLRLTDLVLTKGVGLRILGKILINILPPLISFTIPMAILFAALMAFGRLASDNEVIAFRSCGLHPIRIILPILIFALLAVFVCLWLEVKIIPSANRSFRSILLSFQQQKAFLSLDEKSFQDFGEDMVAYVHKAKKTQADEKGYEGILIIDHSMQGASRVILGREGNLMMDGSHDRLIISLLDGSIHNLEREGEKIYQMIEFGRYETNLQLPGSSVISSRKKKYKELSLNDIKVALKSDSIGLQEVVRLKLEWHRRLAFPFACFIFAFIGSLIGMESKWSGKCSSFALSIVLIIIYYFLLTSGSRLSMAGYIPPGISVWLPNIIFLAVGIGLFREVF